MGDGASDLSGVELNSILGKASFLLQMEEQLASVDVVQNHVEFVLGLEGVVQANDEGMLDLLENALLCFRVGYLLAGDDGFFAEYLHCVNLSCILLLHLHYLVVYNNKKKKNNQYSFN